MRCGTLKCLKKINTRRVNFTLTFTRKTDVGFSREIYNVEFTSLAITRLDFQPFEAHKTAGNRA